MASEKRSNYPVINIGLGTTGGEIVTMIAKMIREEGDQWSKDYVASIVLLSEVEPPTQIDVFKVQNFVRLCPGKIATKTFVDQFAEAADKTAAARFRSWYPAKTDGSLYYPPAVSFEEGCSGFRPAGRLLLHHMRAQNDSVRTHLEALFQRIQQTADAQIRGQKIRAQDIDCTQFVCNVFGNLAGGTASGLFLDFSFLLRSAAAGRGANARVFGYFLTGDTCYRPEVVTSNSSTKMTMQKRNTIRALSELAVVQSATGWGLAAKGWPRKFGIDDLTNDATLAQGNIFPYDVVYLIGASREGERKPALIKTVDYFQLVANAIGQRLTTQVDVERKGSTVDVLSDHRHTWSSEAPRRANEIGSLGYLHVRLPKHKIAAVLSRRFGARLLAGRLKNLDESLSKEVGLEFRNTLDWDNVAQRWFDPPAEDFAPNTGGDSVASDGDDYKTAWLNALGNVKAHYEKWLSGPADAVGGPNSAEAVAAFRKEAGGAVQKMLQRCLSEDTLSFGTLKVVLQGIVDDLSAKIRETNQRLSENNRVLLEGEGFEKKFAKLVAERARSYPSKGMVGFVARWDHRKSWEGHSLTANDYKSIRDAVRLRAQLQATLVALGEFKVELSRLSVVRRLIGKRACYPEVNEAMRREDLVFSETASLPSATQHEVVSSRIEVNRFADSLTGELIKEGEKRFVKAFCRALRGAAVGSGDALYTINELCRLIAKAPQDVGASHDNAWESEEIKQIVMTMRSTLSTAFSEQEEAVKRALETVTIWDAITASIEHKGEEARQELLDFFGRFKAMGKVFWSQIESQENQQMVESKVVVFCDKAAAEEHLARLGVADAGFLENLLQAAFETVPEITDKRKFSELVCFVEKFGISIHPAEFPEVKRILEGTQDAGAIEHWSDCRFPEWIKQMRGG